MHPNTTVHKHPRFVCSSCEGKEELRTLIDIGESITLCESCEFWHRGTRNSIPWEMGFRPTFPIV